MIKKYLLAGALALASLAFGQNYPYGNSAPYGNGGYSQQPGWYGDDYYDDDYYNYAYNNFPDDYYYDFPADYYPTAYYRGYYNDYKRSITDIDWNWLFSNYNISDYQIRQIMSLNRRFNSFSDWNSYYGMNPDRWYYDRFYALERILGPQLILVIQNRYYRGYSPVRYYQNYRRTYYVPNYAVVPKYRYVNVNNYRIDRDRYFQNQRSFRTQQSDSSRNGWDGGDTGVMRQGTRTGEAPNYGSYGNSGLQRTNNEAWNRNVPRTENQSPQGGWRSSARDSQNSQMGDIQRNSGSDNNSGWRNGAREQTVNRSSSDRGAESVLRSGGRAGGFR